MAKEGLVHAVRVGRARDTSVKDGKGFVADQDISRRAPRKTIHASRYVRIPHGPFDLWRQLVSVAGRSVGAGLALVPVWVYDIVT